jgi:hypothetical protein
LRRPSAGISGSPEEPGFARLTRTALGVETRRREPRRRQQLHPSFTAKSQLSFTANEVTRDAGSHRKRDGECKIPPCHARPGQHTNVAEAELMVASQKMS